MREIGNIVLLILLMGDLHAQQRVAIISKCGGSDTVTIRSIIDNDRDGMNDALEQRLLEHFMPAIIQFADDNCPGPALDGSGDSNLVVCHIAPVPCQYVMSDVIDSVKTHPVPLAEDTALLTGMVWYQPLVMVNAAVLY